MKTNFITLCALLSLVSSSAVSATLIGSRDGTDTISIVFNDAGNGILDFNEFVSWDHLTAGDTVGEVIAPYLGRIGSGASVSAFASTGSIPGSQCDGRSEDFCFQSEQTADGNGINLYVFSNLTYRIEGISENNDSGSAAVPLPTPALLLGTALLGGIFAGRRKLNKSACSKAELLIV